MASGSGGADRAAGGAGWGGCCTAASARAEGLALLLQALFLRFASG